MTTWNIYLAGEVHTSWRDIIRGEIVAAGLEVRVFCPVTDHASSDNCGVQILGEESDEFWKDHKGAGLNSIPHAHADRAQRHRRRPLRRQVQAVERSFRRWLRRCTRQAADRDARSRTQPRAEGDRSRRSCRRADAGAGRRDPALRDRRSPQLRSTASPLSANPAAWPRPGPSESCRRVRQCPAVGRGWRAHAPARSGLPSLDPRRAVRARS
jgi:hypothetical protein